MRLACLFAVFLGLTTACATFPQPAVPDKAELADYLKDVTVQVSTESGSLCSGVWVAKDIVLTANHCVDDLEPGEGLMVSVADGAEGKAVVMQQDPAHDLALVGAPNNGAHPIALAGPLPRVGDRVETMGHPVGMGWSYSSGDVAAIRDDVRDGDFQVIQATAPISPGNSGGGLFNERGELVGICSYGVFVRGAQNLNFFIPISYAASLRF